MSNLRSVRITNTIITVEWDPADSPSGCGSVLYYNVTIVNLVDASDMNSSEETVNRVDFSNLKSDTSYSISVAAVNRVGIGPLSTVTETTLTENEESKQYLYVCMYICICRSLATTYLIYICNNMHKNRYLNTDINSLYLIESLMFYQLQHFMY